MLHILSEIYIFSRSIVFFDRLNMVSFELCDEHPCTSMEYTHIYRNFVKNSVGGSCGVENRVPLIGVHYNTIQYNAIKCKTTFVVVWSTLWYAKNGIKDWWPGMPFSVEALVSGLLSDAASTLQKSLDRKCAMFTYMLLYHAVSLISKYQIYYYCYYFFMYICGTFF